MRHSRILSVLLAVVAVLCVAGEWPLGIHLLTKKEKEPVGSAFFVNPNGDMLTSRAVVECCNPDKITIINHGGDKLKADLKVVSKKHDLALLSTDRKVERFASMYVTYRKEPILPQDGDSVYSVGYVPEEGAGVSQRVSFGSVSGSGFDAELSLQANKLSGGAVLLNEAGLLVGMVPSVDTKTNELADVTTPIINNSDIVSFVNRHKIQIASWDKVTIMKAPEVLLHADKVTGVVYCSIKH